MHGRSTKQRRAAMRRRMYEYCARALSGGSSVYALPIGLRRLAMSVLRADQTFFLLTGMRDADLQGRLYDARSRPAITHGAQLHPSPWHVRDPTPKETK